MDWRTDPEVQVLRAHLEAHNGIRGLDVLAPADIRHAVDLFRRDGFVVIADVLNDEQTEILKRGCDEVIGEILSLDEDRKGNRGSHRCSFGGSLDFDKIVQSSSRGPANGEGMMSALDLGGAV